MKMRALPALAALVVFPLLAQARSNALLGPEVGLAAAGGPAALAGAAIGASDKGRTFELVLRSLHSTEVGLLTGGVRASVDLLRLGPDTGPTREGIPLYAGLGVSVGSGSRCGVGLGLVSTLEPFVGIRLRIASLGLASAALSWMQHFTAGAGPGLIAGPALAVAWTPFDDSW